MSLGITDHVLSQYDVLLPRRKVVIPKIKPQFENVPSEKVHVCYVVALEDFIQTNTLFSF